MKQVIYTVVHARQNRTSENMKQVIYTVVHARQNRTSEYEVSSYPMNDYQVEEYISSIAPSNPFCTIKNIRIVDIEE